MLKTTIRIRNCKVFCFIWFVLSFGFLQAQDNKAIPAIEKIYLHTDRSSYFIGEDLWYKAYNVHASNNVLFDNSNILYVELISSDSNIIARNKTKLQKGLGHGDFQLLDSLGVKPGLYQLRAYTNWNRNFGNDFVFKKNIEIINVFESQSKTNKTQIAENGAVVAAITKPFEFKVDFLPEGGSLLENVASVVGFKAVDNNGKPIDVKGEVFDSDNELVTTFESVHDGMGKFQMIPIEGKHYYVKIKTLAGTELRLELPKVSKQGYLLGFKVFRDKNFISIFTNEKTLAQNPNAVLTVICKAKGIPYLETTKTLTETTLSFELPTDKTPEGISQITLLDSNNKPQSERLLYIEKEQDLDIQLVPDKTSYRPNEKVTLNVSSESNAGEGKSGSFSLSVTDMNGVEEDEDYGTNICTYFLMESDIRGKVHNPGYYFDDANSNRLDHLDNLLLTQGWRDFLWKTQPKSNDAISYKAEKGITISGRVKQLFSEKPLVNNNLTLALMGKNNNIFFNATTDSIGRFKFENLSFSGKTKMYLNTRNEKGKSRGEIVLDSIEQNPIPVTFKKESIILPEKTNTVVENVYKKFTAFGVKPENALKEVVITKSKNKHQATTYYGKPNYSYEADKDVHRFTNVSDLISEKLLPGYPNFNLLKSHLPEESEIPLILIDGYPIVDDNQLYMVSPSDVVKIEAVIGGVATMAYGDEARSGIISIITNGNTGNKQKKVPFQSIKKDIDGFYAARIFYSPDPEHVELDTKAAVRNTIYWNPYIRPDATGNTYLNYYNSSVETKVKIELEGITETGIPVVKKLYYAIKK